MSWIAHERLAGAWPAAPHDTGDPRRQLARELVGITFVQPLLKSAHHKALQGKYGHGGRGEEVFAQQLDRVLARRMAAATRFGLVDAVYDDMVRRQHVAGEIAKTAASAAAQQVSHNR